MEENLPEIPQEGVLNNNAMDSNINKETEKIKSSSTVPFVEVVLPENDTSQNDCKNESSENVVRGYDSKELEKNDSDSIFLESVEAADKACEPLLLPINEKSNEPIILINKALCADYGSDSEKSTDDLSSDSDSSSSTSYSSSSNDSDTDSNSNVSKNNGKQKKSHNKITATEMPVFSLPPIEKLQISVPEQACIEMGTITSIVDTLVIVESYKGTAPLDVDTVLFLDCGKRVLGKVFEILGPVSEPIYSIRFNNQQEISSNEIVKGLKVFYAPQTKHTTFVLLSDVLKIRGSDASWKDNVEAPSEFQDFSDDEEEQKFKKKNGLLNGERRDIQYPKGRKRNVQEESVNLNNQQNRNKNVTARGRVLENNYFRGRRPFVRSDSGSFSTFPRPNHNFPCAPNNFFPSPHMTPNLRYAGYPNPCSGTSTSLESQRNFWPPFVQRTQSLSVNPRSPWFFGYPFPPPPPPPPPQGKDEHN